MEPIAFTICTASISVLTLDLHLALHREISELCVLHDPAFFTIKGDAAQFAFELRPLSTFRIALFRCDTISHPRAT